MAIECFNQVLILNPKIIEARYYKALAEYEIQDYPGVIHVLVINRLGYVNSYKYRS